MIDRHNQETSLDPFSAFYEIASLRKAFPSFYQGAWFEAEGKCSILNEKVILNSVAIISHTLLESEFAL